MPKREYNEIYGYLPKDVVNRLPEMTRKMLFVRWLTAEPTEAGLFITKTVMKSLGDSFLEYLFNTAINVLKIDNIDISMEDVAETIKELVASFAKDPNVLCNFVQDYMEQNDLKVNVDETQDNLKSADNETENDEPYRDSRGRLRDSKGHFVKEK